MKTEIEARILEVNKENLIKKLEDLGAVFVRDMEQKRYVYDFVPAIKGKWIRLRTDGVKTTLTIKDIVDKSISGTKELEVTVDDINKTNLLLEELGYKARSYQENKRTRYMYKGVEVDIDSWPLIPTYVELEAGTEEEIWELVEAIGFKKEDTITYSVEDIYKHYGLDINDYDVLKF